MTRGARSAQLCRPWMCRRQCDCQREALRGEDVPAVLGCHPGRARHVCACAVGGRDERVRCRDLGMVAVVGRNLLLIS